MSAENGSSQVRLASVGVALPPLRVTQAEAEAAMSRRYAGVLSPTSLAALRKMVLHPSIRARHFAFDSPEQLFAESADERAARFCRWAVRLSAEAAGMAMARAGLTAGDVAAVIVNTCTGYLCPGISTYLIETMGLRRDIRCHDLLGAGCGGAVPNLELGRDMLAMLPDGAVLCVAVEICSATFQMDNDLSLLVSNALFGDGAAACVLWTRPQGLALVDSARVYAPEHRDIIRYVYRNGQLHNQLSPRLPRIMKHTVAEAALAALARHGLQAAEVPHWAIHPGGEKVINEIKSAVGLSEAQVRLSRGVLADYGNMSSPTVLFALDRLLAGGMAPGDWCMLVGAGAGMSAHAMLLRA